MLYFSKMLALLYMTFFPIKEPLKYLFITSTILAVSLAIIPVCPNFESWAEAALVIAFLVSGYCRATTIIPYMITSQYFDSKGEDKELMGTWSSSQRLGDIFSLIGMSYLIMLFGWKVAFFISIGLFALNYILFCLCSEEVPMQEG